MVAVVSDSSGVYTAGAILLVCLYDGCGRYGFLVYAAAGPGVINRKEKKRERKSKDLLDSEFVYECVADSKLIVCR